MITKIRDVWGYRDAPQKIIAFSLWGENPKYVVGAYKNILLAKKYYPDWICRFYCGADTKMDILHRLKDYNTQVYTMDNLGSWNGMFWRFLPAGEKNVERFISRDTDSRISEREVAAVEEWAKDDTDFHICRDHIYHQVPILGGMWGCKNMAIPDIEGQINNWSKTDQWQTDQDFLKAIIAPKITSATVHDPYFAAAKFPTARIGNEFMGESFDEFDKPNQEHRDLITRFWRP